MKTLHKIFICTGLSTCVLGVGFAVSYGVYQDKCPQVAKAVEYDDENYEIELSVNELNNYVFENLYNYFELNFNDTYISDSSITYNNSIYQYIESFWDNDDGKYIKYEYEGTNQISYDGNGWAESSLYKFLFDLNGTDNFVNFEYSITWNLNSNIYSNIKNAIELDIAANNSQYSYFDFLADSISLLVGGIVPTASGIGGGLSTLVNALAISNNGISPFAAIIFIFGGIALALGLSRCVVNLISSLGQRNR